MLVGYSRVSTQEQSLNRHFYKYEPPRELEEIEEVLRKIKVMLFRSKYRIESARLPGWDYAAPVDYFIMICAYFILDLKVENQYE